MLLHEAFGIESRDTVSLIGAGGKTTTLYRLAAELGQKPGRVLVTTTTKIFQPTKPHVHRLFLAQDVEALLRETAGIPPPVIVGAGYGVDEAGKLAGLPVSWFERLQSSGQFDFILIEADGAASRLFKVPSEHEPVIPPPTSMTIWVMSVKVLGKPLEPGSVHRSERAASLLGEAPGTIVTPEHILSLVKNPMGCLKGLPHAGRKTALLNQADSPEEIQAARDLGRALLPLGIERVVIASYLGEPAVKEVIMN